MKRIICLLLMTLLLGSISVVSFAEECAPDAHSYGDPVKENEIPATCTTDGSYDSVRTCTVCGQKETSTVTVPEKGHTPGATDIENKVEATCDAEGSYEEVVYCTVCGVQLSRQKVIVPSPGHKWDEGTVTKEATCQAVGEKVYKCSVCSAIKYVELPKVDHSYKDGKCIWCGAAEPVTPTTPPSPTTPPAPPSPTAAPQPPLRLTIYTTTNGEVRTGGDVVPNGRTYIINPGDSFTFTFHPYNQYYVYDVIFNGRFYGSISTYTVTYDMMKGQDKAMNVKFASIYASPKTGDDSNLVLWGILAFSSAACAGMILKRKRSRHNA